MLGYTGYSWIDLGERIEASRNAKTCMLLVGSNTSFWFIGSRREYGKYKNQCIIMCVLRREDDRASLSLSLFLFTANTRVEFLFR